MPYTEEYQNLSTEELRNRVIVAREKLGNRVFILGHYYQQDDVVSFADAQGDSYALAKKGAENKDAERIVFCGVHFMAEVSDILKREGQAVYMPDPGAGWPLADLADGDQVRDAWQHLEAAGITKDVVPMTYVNSTAELKAFCGKHGGTACTSSSAGLAFDWAFKQKPKIFFFPDENLGRNTAHAKSIKDDEIVSWDPTERHGGLTEEQLRRARVIAWKGYCHVHTFFTMNHIKTMREEYPDCKIVVHPESDPEVVDASDGNGSTSYLIDYVKNAPSLSTVVVGTEINLVSRLARMFPEKTVVPLARSLCPNMFKTSLRDLCFLLENWSDEHLIRVPEFIAKDAKLALERMLSLK